MSLAEPVSRPRIPTQSVVAFFALTFAITWGIIGSYTVWPESMVNRFGNISGSHPFYFVATWAPAISGIALVVWSAGLQGAKAFVGRLFLWRCPAAWWLLILVGIPLVFITGSLTKGGPILAPIPAEGVGSMIAMMFVMLFLGPIEEFGWRGVAQPLLQRRVAPFWAGAIIGVAWGIWHLPAFYLSGVVFAEWSFLPFFIGNVTLAVLVTPVFNAARGSLLLPMLFHWQLINPFWPDAQPWDTWILVVVTAIVVWWKREHMFSREKAVTEVIPGESRRAP